MGVSVGSCSARNVVVDLPIVAYVPAGCGDAGGASATYTALGDFPQVTPAAETVTLGSVGFALTALPAAAKQIVISGGLDAGAFTGESLVPDGGSVEVLTLPLYRACPLSTSIGGLGDVPGTSIGMMDATHAMIVGGNVPPFVVDLSTGGITRTPSSEAFVNVNYATVSRFGSNVLIAGGISETSDVQSLAQVYTPGSGFTTVALPEGQQRAKHAAVTLANGDVLLVGGAAGSLVTAIDLLDPATMSARVVGALQTGRVLPTVIALPNGKVFIGGGFDKAMNPIPSAEWLDTDLSSLPPVPLCWAGPEQGFAATEGGAVLSVMGGGTPPPGCSNVELVLPSPSGATPAPPLTPVPKTIRLFQGAEASPLLVTDSDVLRWNPWTAAFTSLGMNALGLSTPTKTILAPTPGLAMWLGEDSNLYALRFDTHGEYATDVAHGPYLVTDDQFTAPDQLPALDGGAGNVAFVPGPEATLSNGATIWVTDATFAEVTASVVVLGGPVPDAGAAAPASVTLVLREPGGNEVTCTASSVPPGSTVQVVRSGAIVTGSIGDAGSIPCSGQVGADVRVSVGVRAPGGGGTTRVKTLMTLR